MIFTFYSYKGGVGRTMALANVAELCYRHGLKVLMIDFDLEAPGLERFFQVPEALYQPDEVIEQRGIIDLLLSYKELRDLPSDNLNSEEKLEESEEENFFPFYVEPISNFIVPLYEENEQGASLSIIQAGCRRGEDFPEYAQTVHSFNWNDFYDNWDGQEFFEWFRKEIDKQADIVLIDSRTGVTEMGGVCTYQLADIVVMFVAPNDQNIDGTVKIAQSLSNPELIRIGRKGRELSLVIVPSRVDNGEKELLDNFQKQFDKKLASFVGYKLPFEKGAFLDLKIPYVPFYAYNEKVAVRDAEKASASDLSEAFENLFSILMQLGGYSHEPIPKKKPRDSFGVSINQILSENVLDISINERTSRDALVVGINRYKDEGLPNLLSPAQDAEAVAQVLEQYGNFRVWRLPEALNRETKQPRVAKTFEVSLIQLKRALVNLFKPNSKQIPDTALFYFSGHGLRQDLGIQESFLATSDVFPNLEFNGLSLQWLRRLLQESPIKQQIIWLDCSHSGALLDFLEGDPGELGQAKDRCFMAACRDFEEAYEALTEPYSVFTKLLLQGLDPQRIPQQWITNISLVEFINQNLHNITQRPIFTNFGQPINLTRTWEVAGAKSEGKEKIEICPYKGLEYFDCNGEDPKYFYGREKLTDQLLDRVRQSNFLALLGASGSGKSSVLRAGLLHQLQLGQRLAGSEAWQIQILSPGKHPLENLALSFLDENLSEIERPTQLDQVKSLLQEGAKGLCKLVQVANSQRVVLVIDQFEELFTLCEEQEEKDKFCTCLLGALNQIPEKLCVILAMRVDFLGKCLEQSYSGLGKQIETNLVTVPAMQTEELRAVITKPAAKVKLGVEEELVEQILRDVQGSPGSLPLVQYSLTQLWEGREDNCLKLAKYSQLGGIGGSLNRRATEVYGQLSTPEKKVAKHIFLNLTRLGEGTEDTRRRVFQGDLVTAQHPEDLVARVIRILADEKLVVTSEQMAKGGEAKREAVVDVPHEALIRNWELLREWLDESRSFLLKQREIEAAARKWREVGKKGDYLLQGRRLREAKDFVKEQGEVYPLSGLGLEFLGRSVKQQKNSRVRAVGLFLIIPLLGTSIIGYFIVRERQLTEYKQLLRECAGQEICQGRVDALEKLVQAQRNLQRYNLRWANLNSADLNHANLRWANLESANLESASLIGASLIGANLIGANLEEVDLRRVKLNDVDLDSVNLINVNLSEVDLSDRNLSNKNLSKANLANTALTRVEALGTNFSGANLTGACIEDWNINSQTNLANVQCDYIYLKADKKDRRPHNPNKSFAPGEFTKLFQKAFETIDLFFQNGADWQAVAYSLDKVRVENENTLLKVKAIEDKGDGDVLISVIVPENSDKGKIEGDFWQGYEFAQKQLEGQFQARIEDKNQEINRLFHMVNEQRKLIGDRNININEGNYIQENQGDYYQARNAGIMHNDRSIISDNAKVAGELNENQNPQG